MAYKTGILDRCDSAGCEKHAAYRVYSQRDLPTGGDYCKRHADKRVRELTRTEEEASEKAAGAVDKRISSVSVRVRKSALRKAASVRKAF